MRGFWSVMVLGGALVGCSGDTLPRVVEDTGAVEFVDSEVDTLPRVRFADGQVSVNDRCMVRGVKLNRRMPPMYVNGQPVGFC